jgi:hypothetical protein
MECFTKAVKSRLLIIQQKIIDNVYKNYLFLYRINYLLKLRIEFYEKFDNWIYTPLITQKVWHSFFHYLNAKLISRFESFFFQSSFLLTFSSFLFTHFNLSFLLHRSMKQQQTRYFVQRERQEIPLMNISSKYEVLDTLK